MQNITNCWFVPRPRPSSTVCLTPTDEEDELPFTCNADLTGDSLQWPQFVVHQFATSESSTPMCVFLLYPTLNQLTFNNCSAIRSYSLGSEYNGSSNSFAVTLHVSLTSPSLNKTFFKFIDGRANEVKGQFTTLLKGEFSSCYCRT